MEPAGIAHISLVVPAVLDLRQRLGGGPITLEFHHIDVATALYANVHAAVRDVRLDCDLDAQQEEDDTEDRLEVVLEGVPASLARGIWSAREEGVDDVTHAVGVTFPEAPPKV